jgi:hypothetical protein
MNLPADQVERGRLAGFIRTDNTGDTSLLHLKTEVLGRKIQRRQLSL